MPALRAVHLPPEAVLLLFLPVLLYWESFTSSLREIRSNLRVIVVMSTILVALTAAGVAAAAHALGLPWGRRGLDLQERLDAEAVHLTLHTSGEPSPDRRPPPQP